MTNELQNLHLLPTMAPALSDDPFAKALVKAVELELRSDYEEIQKIILLENLEKQSDNMLDHLARHYHVDFYDDTLTRKQKIALIRNSRAAHMYKGTRYSVELAFESLDLIGVITEWWEDVEESDPGTFSVYLELTDRGITDNTLQSFERLIDAYKNKRSHLKNIQLGLRSTAHAYLPSASISGERLGTFPEVKTLSISRHITSVSSAVQCTEELTAKPKQVTAMKDECVARYATTGQVTEIQMVKPLVNKVVEMNVQRNIGVGSQILEYITGGK